MRKEEQLLQRALEFIAWEEARQTELGMTFSDMQKAKAMQDAHKKQALSLIRRHTRTFSPLPLLRTAAILAVIVGGVLLLRPVSDPRLPLQTATAIPLQPYFSASPLPATPSPIVHTPLPTSTPVYTQEPTTSPTLSPVVAISATPSPTIAPLPTNAPAPSPTHSPTLIPLSAGPEGWSGAYFPHHQAESWQMQEAEMGENSAVLDDNYVFTEYLSSAPLPTLAADIASYRYVSVGGAPALLTEDKAGRYTLTWDVEGRTLSLFAPDGREDTLLQIANSVEKVELE